MNGQQGENDFRQCSSYDQGGYLSGFSMPGDPELNVTVSREFVEQFLRS
jgi:hypothetical protein